MNRPRVLLADDHRIVAEGLRGILEPEFELVGIVENGRELLDAARKLHPDVIVADISMPMLNGIEAARQLKQSGERAKIIFLTMHSDVAYATRAFDAGASGFVLKHAASSELISAIREVLKGRTYITPMIAQDLVRVYREGAPRQPDPARRLTPRQLEVLQLLAEGHSAKEMAAILNISPRTAEFHKYRMMEALEIRTTAELIQYAVKHGLVSE
jgi:DNA-binding NarL/FixJ family response regulator